MKKLLQAATLALSALGSLFTSVEAPKAQASSIQARTTVVEAPVHRTPARAVAPEALAVAVVFSAGSESFDIDKHVMMRISGAPSVKAPVAGDLWYMDVFRELQSSTVAARAAKPVIAIDVECDGTDL